MADRGINPREAAHFLMKSLFCLFAEDIRLLPESVFARILRNAKGDTERLAKSMGQLFTAMREGGAFGADDIPWFNGGLFKDDLVIELTETELKDMLQCANLNWSQVEPSIFGTLFERSLDPGQRAQLGAHYTGRQDIMLIVEPVVLRPMRRQWDAARVTVAPLVEPAQLYGIEINPYAHELAQAVGVPPMALEGSSPGNAAVGGTPPAGAGRMPALRPAWPEADFIIGNPPFLGGKLLRTNFGDEYVDTLFKAYDGDVEAFADLSVYWHEPSRVLCKAVVAIRRGASRNARCAQRRRTIFRHTRSFKAPHFCVPTAKRAG